MEFVAGAILLEESVGILDFWITRPRLVAGFSLKNTRWVTGHQFLLMCCFFEPYKMYENRWVIFHAYGSGVI